MTFTHHYPKHKTRKNFKRSDVEEANRINRERRELQEQYDDRRRAKLNANKGY